MSEKIIVLKGKSTQSAQSSASIASKCQDVYSANYRLTIGLCLYRSDYYARRAFFSAYVPVSQSDDIELLVLDNQPKADRSFIISLLADNVRYIPHATNVGSFGNQLRAWREAKGEFILFLCDDDFLDPFFFENLGEASISSFQVDCDVIASAPTEFERHSDVRRLSRNPDDISALADSSIQRRLRACLGWRYSNYLLWSMYRRKNIVLDVQFSFYAFCPGYLVGLDWPTTDGIILAHQVQQLEYGYYVYNRANWPTSGDASWVARELQSYRKGVISKSAALPDAAIMALRTVNMAAIATAYFLALLQVYQKRSLSFDVQGYLDSVSILLQKCYLSQVRFQGLEWSNVCQPSTESLRRLIQTLSAPLVDQLVYGEKLYEYLDSVSANYQESLDNELFSAYQSRYEKWLHVPLEGLHP